VTSQHSSTRTGDVSLPTVLVQLSQIAAAAAAAAAACQPGVIREGAPTDSQKKLQELRKGECVSVTRSDRVTLSDGTLRVPFECVWSRGGPNLGCVGWTSTATTQGVAVLEEVSAADAVAWQESSLATLEAFMKRQGVDIKQVVAETFAEEYTAVENSAPADGPPAEGVPPRSLAVEVQSSDFNQALLHLMIAPHHEAYAGKCVRYMHCAAVTGEFSLSPEVAILRQVLISRRCKMSLRARGGTSPLMPP
jgi:hypothetical protein